MAYKDHKGRFVSREIWLWLQREKKAAAENKRKKPKLKKGFYYPEGFVKAQAKIRKLRAERGKFKKVTKGGKKAGIQRTSKLEKMYVQGKIAPPDITERTSSYITKVWYFEGLQGELAALHLLDLHDDVKGAESTVSVEAHSMGFSERVGSPYGTTRLTKNWLLGWRNRPSGQEVFEYHDEDNTRLIWEVEIKIPRKRT